MHSGFRRKASKWSNHQKVKEEPFGIATIQILRSIRKKHKQRQVAGMQRSIF